MWGAPPPRSHTSHTAARHPRRRERLSAAACPSGGAATVLKEIPVSALIYVCTHHPGSRKVENYFGIRQIEAQIYGEEKGAQDKRRGWSWPMSPGFLRENFPGARRSPAMNLNSQGAFRLQLKNGF